jgi:hypothetical protein
VLALARDTLLTAITLEAYPNERATVLKMVKATLGWLFYATSHPEYAYLGR